MRLIFFKKINKTNKQTNLYLNKPKGRERISNLTKS